MTCGNVNVSAAKFQGHFFPDFALLMDIAFQSSL